MLWNLLEQGAAVGTVAIAAQQAAGRGQWGRQWQSDLGGLYLSLALEPSIAPTESGQITLCSAWGIAQVLRNLDIPAQIKWPNDLVIEGRKLGGILTETRIQDGQLTKAVIGVGLNWQNPVPETGIQLQETLAQHHNPCIQSLEHLAAIVLRGIVWGYQVLQQEGTNVLLQNYQGLLANLDQIVTIDGHPGCVTGVSASGDLRVRLEAVSSQATATEIHLKPGTISLGYR